MTDPTPDPPLDSSRLEGPASSSSETASTLKTPLDLAADLALWQRIQQAINATTLRRSLAEELFGEPCHRKQCARNHGSIQSVVNYTISRVHDAVYLELLCKATSDPDLGEHDDQA